MCKKKDHKVDGNAVRVEPYNRYLGLPLSCEKNMGEDTLVVALDSYDIYKIKFLRRNKKGLQALETELGEAHAEIDWKVEPVIINCVLTKEQPQYRKLRKTWKEAVNQIIKTFFNGLETKRQNIEREYWDEILKELYSLNLSHPDDIALILEKGTEHIVLVGKTEVFQKSWGELKSAVEKAIKAVKESKEKVTKTEKLQAYKAKYLAASNFERDVKSEFKNVDVNIDQRTGKVTLSGPKNQVDKCLLQMYELIKNICTKTVQVESEHGFLLRKEKVKSVIAGSMKQHRLTNVWEVADTDLRLYADEEEDLDKMENVIQNALSTVTTELDRSLCTALKSKEWADEEAALKRKLQDCVIITVKAEEKVLKIFILADNEDYVRETLDRFCSNNAEYTESMSVDPPVAQYMDKHMFKEISRRMDKLRDENMAIKWKIHHKGTINLQGIMLQLKLRD